MVLVAGQAAVSACAVLLAYAVLNVAALRLPTTGRRWPRRAPALGLVLAASLPPVQVLVSVVLVAVGWAAATVRVTP